MLLTRLLTRIVDFFRDGYPAVAVDTGYVPLLALYKRRLTDDEVSGIATELMSGENTDIDRVDVRVAITKLVDDLPSLEDAERVNRRIADAGRSVVDGSST